MRTWNRKQRFRYWLAELLHDKFFNNTCWVYWVLWAISGGEFPGWDKERVKECISESENPKIRSCWCGKYHHFDDEYFEKGKDNGS